MSRVPALVGWPLLSVPDANGQLDYPTPEVSVRQQIQIILSTRPGEQLLRPSFGAGLDAFIHEPNTVNTWRAIHDRVIDSLGQWEPRITVDRVEVGAVDGKPAQARVQIFYRLRRTGAPGRVGLTLALGA